MCVVKSAATIDTLKGVSLMYKIKISEYVFWWKSVLWSPKNTASCLMMQTNLMQNFSALLNHTYHFLGGSTCLPILSPKPVPESASADFIGRRRLRASFI